MDKEAVKKLKEIEDIRKKKESEKIKVDVKKMNVLAVAKVLTDMQDDNHKVKSEHVDLKKLISKATQDLGELRAEIIKLKAMGFRGNIGGTGSTVHKQGE